MVKVDAREFLSSRFTIKKEIVKRADVEKVDFSQKIQLAISQFGIVGLSTDMWKDIKNRHFLSLTVHYIEKKALESAITQVSEFKEEKKR